MALGMLDHTEHEDMNSTSDPNCIPPTAMTAQADKLDLILQEVSNSRKAIEQQVSAIATGLTILKADHSKLADTVRSNKLHLAELMPQHKTHMEQIEHLRRQLSDLQDRVDDTEGRARRNYV